MCATEGAVKWALGGRGAGLTGLGGAWRARSKVCGGGGVAVRAGASVRSGGLRCAERGLRRLAPERRSACAASRRRGVVRDGRAASARQGGAAPARYRQSRLVRGRRPGSEPRSGPGPGLRRGRQTPARGVSLVLEPNPGACELHQGKVVSGSLVVAGCDGSKALEVVKKDFDEIALAVESSSEAMLLESFGL